MLTLSNSWKEFVKSDVPRLVASQSAINLFCYIFRIIVSFLTVVLASRWLGVEKYGEFNLLLSYTVYLSYLLPLGFDQSLPFFVSKVVVDENSHALKVFFQAIKIIFIFGCIILSIATIWIFDYYHDSKKVLLVPMLLLTFQHFIFSIGSVGAAYLRGYKIFWPWILKEQLVAPLMQLVFLVVFVKLMDLGILGYSIAYALAITVSFIAVMYFFIPFIRKQIKEKKKDLTVANKEMIRFSFPLGVMSSLQVLIVWTSITLAGNFLTSRDAGLIAVCMRLAVFVQFLFLVLKPIFTPYIAEFIRLQNHGEVKRLYQMVNYWSAKWSLLIIFGILMSSKLLLSFFGTDFIFAEMVLYWILPGFFISSLLGAACESLVMSGIAWFNASCYAVAILVNIALCYLLVKYYQLNGIAIAFSGSLAILNLLMSMRFYLNFKILPLEQRQTVNLIIMVVALWILGYSVKIFFDEGWQQIVVGLAIFFAGMMASFWRDRKLFVEPILNKFQNRPEGTAL